MAGKTAAVTAALALSVTGTAQAGGPNPVALENGLPGTRAWIAAEADPPAIEGYASETSVLPGEALHLHVAASPPARYVVRLYRLGWYDGAGGRLFGGVPGCGADELAVPGARPAPELLTGRVHADWPVTDVLPLPATAASGYYIAQLALTTGPQTGRVGNVYFVVRSADASQIVVQVPVNTWQAYNGWGGKSLYNFNSTGGIPANRVSFDRPYAPRGQSPLGWEIQLVRFLEQEGYDVSYQSDLDTHRDPAGLLRHRLVVVAGHDEYWTKEMRDGFDAARDAGTNLAFMGANDAYWQVRYEDDGRTLVGYKSVGDPNPDWALKTTLFRELVPPRFECELLGVQHQGGFRHPGEPQLDYVVTPEGASDPWLRGTRLVTGSVLPDLVGREWDSIPAYLPEGCRKPGLTALFHHDGASGPADAVRYTAPSGARVFSAGSLQFSWALDAFGLDAFGHVQGPDPRVQQFTRNALADLLRPAAPISVTAAVGRTRWVWISLVVHADPRVRAYAIFRHAGAEVFDPSGLGARRVCLAAAAGCSDRVRRPGVYRYAAEAVDAWNASQPVFSAPVDLRRGRRRPR